MKTRYGRVLLAIKRMCNPKVCKNRRACDRDLEECPLLSYKDGKDPEPTTKTYSQAVVDKLTERVNVIQAQKKIARFYDPPENSWEKVVKDENEGLTE